MLIAQWRRIVLIGLIGGLIVNICEWAAHRIWLEAPWREAFAALGKTPTGWTSFIPTNFILGVVAVWGYCWLSQIYGTSFATALKAAVAVWCIFWVFPVGALMPLEIFPNRLLLLTILVGIADGGLVTLFISWLYDGWQSPQPTARFNSATSQP